MTSVSNDDLKVKEILNNKNESEYGNSYKDHIFEQYKLYLQTTDKISDRRALANTYFLTINTGLIAAIAIIGKSENIKFDPFILMLFLFGEILFCFVWYRMLRSYKDLNSAKFKVICIIEEYLPLRLFDAEWESVGRGKNKKLYLPFSKVELYVPFIFMLMYFALFVYLVLINMNK